LQKIPQTDAKTSTNPYFLLIENLNAQWLILNGEKINTAIKTVYFMLMYIAKELLAAYCINCWHSCLAAFVKTHHSVPSHSAPHTRRLYVPAQYYRGRR
jgi:hypothetical protein